MSLHLPNYTQVGNEFIENMGSFSGSEVKVFLAICRKTIGWHKKTERVSYSQLQDMTGLSINSLKNAVDGLIKADMISRERTRSGYVYDINIVSKKDTVSHTVSKIDTVGVSKTDIDEGRTVSKIDTTKEREEKEKEKETVYAIIEHINKTTGRNFSVKTKAYTTSISARLKEGDYAIDDVKKMIEVKWREWRGTQWEKFVNPTTLFRPANFDRYMNQESVKDLDEQWVEENAELIKL